MIEREIKERESNTELMPEMPIILIEKYKFRESRKKQLKKVICCFEIKAVIYHFWDKTYQKLPRGKKERKRTKIILNFIPKKRRIFTRWMMDLAYRELIGSLYESWTIGIERVYK